MTEHTSDGKPRRNTAEPADLNETDAQSHLRSLVERVERLETDKKETVDDIRSVYAEAKALGFNVKVLRSVIRLRGQDRNERLEYEAFLDMYLHALGME